MITALSVKIPEKKKGLGKVTDKLRRDRIEVEDKNARGVTLRHITYTSYSGELRLEKINFAVGVQRGRLLCSDRLIFPRQSGYRRFTSSAFSSRLCTNFALSVLNNCKNAAGLRVAIYDPAAYCADFLLSVLAHCSDVSVVTSCFEPYLCVAERALSETGAAAKEKKSAAHRWALSEKHRLQSLSRLPLQNAERLRSAKARRAQRGILLLGALHHRLAVCARLGSAAVRLRQRRGGYRKKSCKSP